VLNIGIDASWQKGRHGLSDVSFSVALGSFVVLFGESGSGKSTIARWIVEHCLQERIAVGWIPQHVMQVFPPRVRVHTFIRCALKSTKNATTNTWIHYLKKDAFGWGVVCEKNSRAM
jgi:ABC-type dipeptide/oligopeptide/nickel transport system ATPase subunit